MIETHVLPRGGVVTRSAIRSKLSVVNILRRVAGKTVCRRAFELPIDMTCRTNYLGVTSVQRKVRLAVIEENILPRCCSVT